MLLDPGTRLGPYEILAPLGAGGMGEVYKARDTRLDRLVAIKILPPGKASGEERRRRFLQEAKAASALNHPNIVVIYDIGSENSTDFIVMELVAGKSLDQFIPRAGMRFNEILRAAIQIADAFSKAHAAGIVHRDLKPANVMLTPEGQVKILDFGLAKLTQPTVTDSDATRTICAQTGEGVVLGTTAYMSPEQAEARPVDVRSDIFAFGSLLYEMSTGHRAFHGDTQASTISSILRDDPKPVNESRPEIPFQFARVINRCLRKDPARRFQHMDDLKIELEELKEESDSGRLYGPQPVASAPPRNFTKKLALAGAAVIVLAAAGLLATRFESRAPAPETPLQPIPFTTYVGDQENATFSPDGAQVAFDWNGEKGDKWDIYVKLIGPGAPLRLTTAGVDVVPSWSPDGHWIAFERYLADYDGMAMIVPPLGGPERKLADLYRAHSFTEGGGICWTRDSKWVIFGTADHPGGTARLVMLGLETGERKTLTNPSSLYTGDGAPALSPDGRTLAFYREKSLDVGEIYLLDLSPDSTGIGEPRRLNTGNVSPARHPVWTADGRDIVFDSGERTAARIYRVPASGKSPPHLLEWTGPGAGDAAISASAHRMAYTSNTQNSIIYRISSDGKSAPQPVITSTFREVFPQYSPDGKHLLFYTNRSGSVQVWTSAADGTGQQQLTNMKAPITGSPRWSPDGASICFDSNAGGAWRIYVMHSDGGQPRALTNGGAIDVTCSWSHDGRFVYYAHRAAQDEIWKVPAVGGEPVRIAANAGASPLESPDGKWIYYAKNDGGDTLAKIPVAGGPETVVLPSVYRANFVPTDRGVYFTSRKGPPAIQYLDFATGAVRVIHGVDKPIDLGLTLSPDGHSILWSQVDHQVRNLMLVDNFR